MTHDSSASADRELAVEIEHLGVRVTITPSAGSDGAIVVFIDTDFEPDRSAWNGRSEGPGLRVLINDSDAFIGVPWQSNEDALAEAQAAWDAQQQAAWAAQQQAHE